jgi:methylthioribose-1-phosphate isomerase
MSLSEQLEELERQRADEVRTLHCTYLRTKREVQRTLSPTRIVRKHLPLSLAAGAALGLLLAPRPSPRPVSEEATERAVRKAHRKASRSRGISISWAKRMLTKFFPQAAEYLPDDADLQSVNEKIHEEAETIREENEQHAKEVKKEAKKQKKGGLASLLKILEAVLPMVASKIDWRTLINQVMHSIHQKMNEHKHNGHEPHVSVADAGTIKPDDYQNFE